jgi:putative salt-induced outer membrane protein YdiY
MKPGFTFAFLFLVFQAMFGQSDSLTLKNGDVLIGEIKELDKGVILMETSYSDKDFKIEFNKVTQIQMQRKSLLILAGGERRFGLIRSQKDGEATITNEEGKEETFQLKEIVGLQEVYDNFWKRFRGEIDLGFTLTKANNTRQFTVGGYTDYTGEKWLLEGAINLLQSTQDDAEKVRRTDANVELIRVLPKKWYLLGDISYLSNTEQLLDGRTSFSLGLGKYLLSTNKLYWGLSTGFTYNIENYVDEALNKSSSEFFIATSLEMFDFEDIDLRTGLEVYPSLSESGRVRADYDITMKYDLPLDLFIKLGFILNYDNQPAANGSQTDYVIISGFGWDFD